MSQKYGSFDQKLFKWLAENRSEVTTSKVIEALNATSSTLQRHISRRFTQLEDRGVLVCRLEGTTRICSVEKEPPTTMAKKRWRPGPGPVTPLPQVPGIPAANSEEFLAAGGQIQRIPTQWDRKPSCNATGLISIDQVLAALD